MKHCLGCGFCCLMEPCRVATSLHGDVLTCPELIFEDGKHRCALVKKDFKLVKDMMGIGCGVSWNRWRKYVKKRTKDDYFDYLDKDLIHDITKSCKGM